MNWTYPPPKRKRKTNYSLKSVSWGRLRDVLPFRLSHHAQSYTEHAIQQILRARNLISSPKVREVRETEFNGGVGYTIWGTGFDGHEMQTTITRGEKSTDHCLSIYVATKEDDGKEYWYRLWFGDLSDYDIFSNAQEVYINDFCSEEIKQFMHNTSRVGQAFGGSRSAAMV
jgi:hypothetical protein